MCTARWSTRALAAVRYRNVLTSCKALRGEPACEHSCLVYTAVMGNTETSQILKRHYHHRGLRRRKNFIRMPTSVFDPWKGGVLTPLYGDQNDLVLRSSQRDHNDLFCFFFWSLGKSYLFLFFNSMMHTGHWFSCLTDSFMPFKWNWHGRPLMPPEED